MSLELRNVSKVVGNEVHIHPTDLTLEDEGFNILLGTTLAGKTTLMQLMAGLQRPTEGEVWFRGRNVTGVPVQQRNVSMVYQQFINYPNFDVFENIASPLRVAGMKTADIKPRVYAVSDLLRLTPMLHRRPSELSGGQQQRTALARALVKDADLVLLDEPLANLDFKLREELRDELPKLLSGRGCTVVYATTEPSEALLLGGHTAALAKGRVRQFGPTGTVYREPTDLESAAIFSEPPINTIGVRKRGGRLLAPGDVDWAVPPVLVGAADGDYTLALRPHNVTIERRHNDDAPLSGKVLVTEISGSESVIHFELPNATWVSQSHGVHRVAVGSVGNFFADLRQAMLFTPTGERVRGSA
ncbi:MAG TPA: ABC transporter ATP-binding protein [Devosiaceae bacterium]|jgi:glycerol transport system ATP-binding protein|nr:ABC transporter ATP-binding protein [Devosiaceae bacterium]